MYRRSKIEYSNLHKLLYHIIKTNPGISKTKLVKLCFLIDWEYKNIYGKTFTGTNYISYHYGPYAPAISNAINDLEDFEIKMVTIPVNYPNSYPVYAYSYNPNRFVRGNIVLDSEDEEKIDNILRKYVHKELKDLLNLVYNIKIYKESNFGEFILSN